MPCRPSVSAGEAFRHFDEYQLAKYNGGQKAVKLRDALRMLKPDAADAVGSWNYLVNVASAKNGIGYRKWIHIDGWSDKVLDYTNRYETGNGER